VRTSKLVGFSGSVPSIEIQNNIMNCNFQVSMQIDCVKVGQLGRLSTALKSSHNAYNDDKGELYSR
jgi:hypothetical protein